MLKLLRSAKDMVFKIRCILLFSHLPLITVIDDKITYDNDKLKYAKNILF